MAPALASFGKYVDDLFVTCLMLIGAFLALGIGVWYIRRWQRGPKADSSAPWTFEDLRKLRDQGKLTEEEYQALRAEIIGIFTGEAPSGGSPSASRSKEAKDGEASWDWVAPNDPGPGGFDVK